MGLLGPCKVLVRAGAILPRDAHSRGKYFWCTYNRHMHRCTLHRCLLYNVRGIRCNELICSLREQVQTYKDGETEYKVTIAQMQTQLQKVNDELQRSQHQFETASSESSRIVTEQVCTL